MRAWASGAWGMAVLDNAPGGPTRASRRFFNRPLVATRRLKICSSVLRPLVGILLALYCFALLRTCADQRSSWGPNPCEQAFFNRPLVATRRLKVLFAFTSPTRWYFTCCVLLRVAWHWRCSAELLGATGVTLAPSGNGNLAKRPQRQISR